MKPVRVRMAVLAAALCLFLGDSAPLRADMAGKEAGQSREVVADSQRLRIVVPAGFCAVDPQRGGNHAKLWQAFTPPPQRGSKLLALEIDCATLEQAEAGRLSRPKSLVSLLDSPVDPELPGTLAGALDILEKRYRQPELDARAPVLGRDGHAVYVAQQSTGAKVPLTGVTGVTLLGGRPFFFNIIHFDGTAVSPAMQQQVARSIEALHEKTP